MTADEKSAARITREELGEDAWLAHIAYLEEEVKKVDDRVVSLEAMAAGQQDPQKKLSLQELVNRLRAESAEHRKYLALIKRQ